MCLGLLAGHPVSRRSRRGEKRTAGCVDCRIADYEAVIRPGRVSWVAGGLGSSSTVRVHWPALPGALQSRDPCRCILLGVYVTGPTLSPRTCRVGRRVEGGKGAVFGRTLACLKSRAREPRGPVTLIERAWHSRVTLSGMATASRVTMSFTILTFFRRAAHTERSQRNWEGGRDLLSAPPPFSQAAGGAAVRSAGRRQSSAAKQAKTRRMRAGVVRVPTP